MMRSQAIPPAWRSLGPSDTDRRRPCVGQNARLRGQFLAPGISASSRFRWKELLSYQRERRNAKNKNRAASQQSAKAVIREFSRFAPIRHRCTHRFVALDACWDLFPRATAKPSSFF